jgi:putative chitinase
MIVLTESLLKKVIPNAPKDIVAAFLKNQTIMNDVLADADSAALAFAHIKAETNGYALRGLTENINYTAQRMVAVWPNRFASVAVVQARFGTGQNWQLRAFDEIYGNRMGNRPHTGDGSKYIGRGGPQITGRDGYAEIGKRINRDLVNNPVLATSADLQPAILEAFWDWKNLNRFVAGDKVDVVGSRKVWNGGTNGLAEVQKEFKRLRPIFAGATHELVVASATVGTTITTATAAASAGLSMWAIAGIVVVGLIIAVVVVGLIANHKKEKANVEISVIPEPENAPRIPD